MANYSLPNDLWNDVEDSSRESEFLHCLGPAYRQVYASVLAIVGNRHDADDAVQEVCVVLWQKYDEFEPGTNFRRWACTVAFNVAKDYARKQRRIRGRGLGDQVLMKVAQVQSGGSELLELQRETLRKCVEQLGEADRKFLAECYQTPESIAQQARVGGGSVTSRYTKLKRLRRRLSECVRRGLGMGASDE